MKKLMAMVAACVVLGAAAEEPALRFGFMTDTHVGAAVSTCDRARSALTLFRDKGVDLVVHGGDVANTYDPAGYVAYKGVFAEVFAEGARPPQVFAIGNHDVMETGSLTAAEAATQTLATLGAANQHTDTLEFGGFAFLVTPYGVGQSGTGFISWSEYEDRVAAACAAHPGKPVFVLEHEPPQDTVYNSHNWGHAQRRAILNKYPQVVELSGHVHGSLRNDQFLWQGQFTVLNGCCLSSWNGLLDGAMDPVAKPSYAVLTVEVYADRLVAHRWDILDGTEIAPDSVWTIPLPFVASSAPYNREKLTAAEVVPSFGAGVTLDVACNEKAFNGYTVTFPELAGNVMTYWITLTTSDGMGGRIVKMEKEIFSEFWKEPSARTGVASFQIPVAKLEPNVEYAITVQPLGQYRTAGEPLTAVVRTPAEFPGETPDYYVEYIESNGYGYIDTEVIGRSGTKAELDVYLPGTDGDHALLDVRKDSSDSRFFLCHVANRCPGIGYGKYIYVPENRSVNLSDRSRYRMVSELAVGRQTFDLDGARIYSGSNPTPLNTGRNLYLFACNYNTPQYVYAVRCYGLKIWQTDDEGQYRLVRDFVPCVKKNVPGLYDKVSHRIFYGRKASDGQSQSGDMGQPPSFSTRKVPGKPDCYVEYVESDGRQILDTGVPGWTGVRAAGEIGWLKDEPEQTFLGVNHGQAMYLVHSVWKSEKKLQLAWFSYGSDIRIYPTVDGQPVCWVKEKRHRFDADYTSASALSYAIDGKTIWTCSTNVLVDSGHTISAFAVDYFGTLNYGSFLRCYGFKMWLEGRLVRDFKPCVKDGQAGLYDAVRDEVLIPVVPFASIGRTVDAEGQPFAFVDYVESNGSNYIDTEVIGRSGTKMEADLMYRTIGGDFAFLGARKNSGDTRLFPFHCHANHANLGYETFITPSATPNLSADVAYHVESTLEPGNQTLDVDGKRIYTGTNWNRLDTGINLTLFAVNYAGTPNYHSRVRLYGLKLWQTDDADEYRLVRDFKPCVVFSGEGSNSVGGLYDAVSGRVFLPPSGGRLATSSGVVEVDEQPDRMVEYIQSDGRQLLDTGVPAESGLKAEGDFMYWSETDTEQAYFASYLNQRFYVIHQAKHQAWAACGADQKEIQRGYLTYADGSKAEYVSGRKYHFLANYPESGDAFIDLDGERIMTAATPGVPYVKSATSMGLFGCGAPNCGIFNSKTRCYGLKLWFKGELVRDFKPCVKGGKGCLYDAVSGHLFYPRGVDITGANVGSVVSETPRDRKDWLEYIESDGSVWLDTGIIGRSGTRAEITFMPLWRPDSAGDWSWHDMGLLGSRTDLYGNTNRFFLCHSAQGALGYGYGGFGYAAEQCVLGSLTTGVVHTVKTDLNEGLQTVVLNGQEVWREKNTASVDTGLPMYLFAENVGGRAMYNAKARIYRVRIWQDGVLVRNYRPVMTDVGEAAFYDFVSRTCCSGSGRFWLYGPVTGPAKAGAFIIIH